MHVGKSDGVKCITEKWLLCRWLSLEISKLMLLLAKHGWRFSECFSWQCFASSGRRRKEEDHLKLCCLPDTEKFFLENKVKKDPCWDTSVRPPQRVCVYIFIHFLNVFSLLFKKKIPHMHSQYFEIISSSSYLMCRLQVMASARQSRR